MPDHALTRRRLLLGAAGSAAALASGCAVGSPGPPSPGSTSPADRYQRSLISY